MLAWWWLRKPLSQKWHHLDIAFFIAFLWDKVNIAPFISSSKPFPTVSHTSWKHSQAFM
jgi:hypothetical protein